MLKEAQRMSNSSLADRNYNWFENNLPELVKVYNEKYVVIKDESIIAAYPSFDEAFTNTVKTETPGTFIIQLCSLDKEKTTQMFFSNRVSFA